MSKTEIPGLPEWTTVKLAGRTWCRLNGEKRPGESFDRTINRLIDTAQGAV